jgi:transketolase
MLIYSLLYLSGYKDIRLEDIKNFRQLGSRAAGHPENFEAKGIETTTGPLGQGIANAVGMAISEKMLNAKYGDDLFNHYTYALCGDGCLMEGISQEAMTFAAHHKLNKLIYLWDDNNITIDGEVSVSTSEDNIARFKAAGWHVE